jgi:hypothetical protein
MRFFYAFVILLFLSSTTNAQCIPDTSITHNDPGTYPDSLTGLPHASVGQSYSTVIQAKILSDTSVGPLHATIDSIVVTGITGLPNGFSHSCTPSSCSFPGGTDACFLLEGLPPTSQMIGTYPIIVHTTIYFKIAGTPQSIVDDNDDYSITIDTTTGILSPQINYFFVGQNIPNPAGESTVIPVTTQKPGDISLTIVNLIGKKVFNRTYTLQRGKNNISVDLHNFTPGIYLYTFSNGATSLVRRMIITNN